LLYKCYEHLSSYNFHYLHQVIWLREEAVAYIAIDNKVFDDNLLQNSNLDQICDNTGAK